MAILGLAALTGGYVAARMARFAGWKQGLAVWLMSALVALAAAVTAWIAGGELDPTESISMPSNPVDERPLSNGPVLLSFPRRSPWRCRWREGCSASASTAPSTGRSLPRKTSG